MPKRYDYLVKQINRGYAVYVNGKVCKKIADLPTTVPGHPKAKPAEKGDKPASKPKPKGDADPKAKPADKGDKPSN